MSHELKIIFYPPKRSYKKLKNIASQFTMFVAGDDTGSLCQITINKDNFKEDCSLLLYFWNIVKKYPDTTIYLDGKHQTREQAETILGFVRCFANRQYFPDQKEYCFICPNKPGFGCKQLCSVIRHQIFGRHKGKYWYQVGPFDGQVQYIDKNDIKELLRKEATQKGLGLCPCFDIKLAEKYVDKLPEQINPLQNPDWIYDISTEPENKGEPVGVKPKPADIMAEY